MLFLITVQGKSDTVGLVLLCFLFLFSMHYALRVCKLISSPTFSKLNFSPESSRDLDILLIDSVRNECWVSEMLISLKIDGHSSSTSTTVELLSRELASSLERECVCLCTSYCCIHVMRFTFCC